MTERDEMTKIELPRLLHEKGYRPLKVQDRAVASAALSSLSVLGESSIRALLFHICSLAGMQERQLLSNYKEFERTLCSALGSGADIILKRFYEELSRNVQRSGMSPNEILETIGRDEPYVFMRNVMVGEHVLLLYRDRQFRDRMLDAFFDPVQSAGGLYTKGAILSDLDSNELAIPSVTWQDLQKGAGPTGLEEKLADWITTLGVGKLRLARDNTYLLENDIDEIPVTRFRDATLICTCDIRVGIESTSRATESHNYVVLEDSKTVYTK
jgi:hypothetical protein